MKLSRGDFSTSTEQLAQFIANAAELSQLEIPLQDYAEVKIKAFYTPYTSAGMGQILIQDCAGNIY